MPGISEFVREEEERDETEGLPPEPSLTGTEARAAIQEFKRTPFSELTLDGKEAQPPQQILATFMEEGDAWTAENLLEFHSILTTRAKALMERKNHDYAGRSGLSPFANFETSEQLGVVRTEQGIMVRLLDKIKRLASFLESGEFKVEDEKLDDTVLDGINYLIILSAYLRQKHGQTPFGQ